jgi:peptide alpha-N-acetyltransferase
MVSLAAEAASAPPAADTPLEYVQYTSEAQMPHITGLIEKDLSEPYSIFTYRYFINNWPNLCFLCMSGAECVGVIVCKADEHRGAYRGYIAMLAVDSTYRKRRIGE